jgi:hypothetical protein
LWRKAGPLVHTRDDLQVHAELTGQEPNRSAVTALADHRKGWFSATRFLAARASLCITSRQHRALTRKLTGHYAYFGITSNGAALSRLREQVRNVCRKWLSRRSQRAALSWNRMLALLKRYSLPRPRIVHRYGT